MADHSKIEWTDATWNPITGCALVSPGCTNCYAMRLAGTLLKNHKTRYGLTTPSKAGPVWNGQVRFNEQWLDQPLRWRRPRRIFVCAHGDLFHESVPDSWIDRVFAVMALAPQHTFQVLTKRSARMKNYALSRFGGEFNMHLSDAMMELNCDTSEDDMQDAADWTDLGKPLPNVHLYVSCEDQARADERIPDLLATPAAVRGVSLEPLLGPIDLKCLHYQGMTNIDALTGRHGVTLPLQGHNAKLDHVIVGGESGPGAWAMHPDWVRSIRDQCQAAAVPFFFKQWGEWLTSAGLDPARQMRGRISPAWLREDGFVRDGFLPYSSTDSDDLSKGAIVEHKWIKCARVGKRRAGRMLDGRTWDQLP